LTFGAVEVYLSRQMRSRSTRIARLLVWLLSALAFFGLYYSFAHRLAYPYDLEWMEGGMLAHALRLVEGKPLYGPPTLDFVPFLYTPLYPSMLALLAKAVGVTYPAARMVSVLSYLGASLLGFLWVRREGRSTTAALAAVAIPAAAYVPTGAWYDLARPDSLSLLLTTLGLYLGWVAACSLAPRRAHLLAVAAAVVMVAAFLAKQTASPFLLALAAALFVRRWRVALSYLAALALVGLPLLLLLNQASQGWFWTFVFSLHQHHAFRAARGFLAAPGLLLMLLGPGLILVGWALRYARTPGLVFACWIALVGWFVSCLGYGTQWSFVNAIVPGVFFTAPAIGIAAGRLLSSEPERPRARLPLAVLALLVLSLLAAPNGIARLILPLAPASWKMAPRALTGYDPRPFLPGLAELRAGEELIARLRQVRGEVLLPPHPFYASLAGKRVFLHAMGLFDVTGAGLPPPAGVAEALRQRRFALVMLDDGDDAAAWPGLLEGYCRAEEIDGPRMLSGTPLTPRALFVPDPDGARSGGVRPCAGARAPGRPASR